MQNRAAQRYITQQAPRCIEIVGFEVTGDQDDRNERKLCPQTGQRVEDFHDATEAIYIDEQKIKRRSCFGCLGLERIERHLVLQRDTADGEHFLHARIETVTWTDEAALDLDVFQSFDHNNLQRLLLHSH